MRPLFSATGVLPALLASLAALPAPAELPAQVQDRADLVAALDSAARAYVANETVPGISVAVVRGADTLLLRGYGHADLEWEVPTPADASASYEIGSVTKQFTAAAVLKLVEAGLLDLDADVTEYLPDFDIGAHRVPLRRLLDHTSGIQGYTEMPVFGEIVMEELPRDSLVSLIEAEPFLFEPGTAQIYNNSAYFLLGLIIEEAADRSYQDYVREELFEPAGMADSYYCSESEIRTAKAHGYDAGPDGLVHKGYLDHLWPFAAGSLCSTAGDLVRWNRALHGGRVLSQASYEAMTTPVALPDGTELDYAMGLSVGGPPEAPTYSHGGGINGFLSYASYHTGDDVVIVVLQNSVAPPGPASLAETITDLLWGPDPEPEVVAYEGDPDALVGEYAGASRGGHLHMVVTRDGDALVFRTPGQVEEDADGIRAVHVGDGVWWSEQGRFWFDTSGGPARELMVAQGGRYRLTRVP